VRRDEVVGILLALFLGTFAFTTSTAPNRPGDSLLLLLLDGYHRHSRLYRVLFHAGPCTRVQPIQAAGIAAMLGISMPGWGYPFNVTVNVPAAPQPVTLVACGRCGRPSRMVRGSAQGAVRRSELEFAKL